MSAGPLQDVPSSDYCEYFFIRSREAGGLVVTADPAHQLLVGESMLAHNRGSQLFKFQAIPGNDKGAQIIHQATGLALSIETGPGHLILATPDGTDPNQQWAMSTADQLQVTGSSDFAVQIDLSPPADYRMQPSDPNNPAQQFELFFPSDFVYIRNSWTGRLLSTDGAHGASWQAMNPAADDYQQWGITSDGFIVSRATGEVLQLGNVTPSAGLLLGTAPQAAPETGNLYQRFDVMNPDGTIKTQGGFVIGMNGSQAVTADYSPSDYTQLTEPLSPFQFFGLQNGAPAGQACLTRNGNNSIIAPWNGDISQVFTVSRYGEIISLMDGYVLQSQGPGASPIFVDPAPDPIGFDTTTFQYGDSAAAPGCGQIVLRSNSNLGLLLYAERTGDVPWIYWLQPPVSGNQAWQMFGPPDGLFAAYQDIAREFFANPAPLPGEASAIALAAADPELAQLVEAVPKTAKVIITLITGILDIAAGISVGTVADSVVTKVAKVVLGNADLEAKIAVIMQGTVTAASVIAVADGITRAGLWWQIFKLLLPNSFWGWAITIAKLGITIAAWAVPGLGPAVTGAKIAVLVADILLIINSDPAAAHAEAAALMAHVEQRLNLSAAPDPLAPAPREQSDRGALPGHEEV